MCGEYTDYTRSYHHTGSLFWVGSSRNWSVFLERPSTGRHEKAPVHCPCSLLAALHVDPRTQASGCKMFANVHLFYAGYIKKNKKTLDMQSRKMLPGFSTGFIVFFCRRI